METTPMRWCAIRFVIGSNCTMRSTSEKPASTTERPILMNLRKMNLLKMNLCEMGAVGSEMIRRWRPRVPFPEECLG